MAQRIIGGRARGGRLSAPPNGAVRPSGDRVREALFNILGQHLDGWRVLDVCAGSGAISLEALSRGAGIVVALELEPALCRHIQQEALRLKLSDGLEIRRGDVREGLRSLRNKKDTPFDLAFVDPPWKEDRLRQAILDILMESPPLCRIAVVECPSNVNDPIVPVNVQMVRKAVYGGTALLFYEWDEK